ncbi:uncharacterized protein LOC143036581 [Oratosquilla oratoria]|uniref:uncharacterized protein LOC143036581 n=1 Tax=Oratosquilla oratoria TaxID=337810 RepID=UPI003F765BCA
MAVLRLFLAGIVMLMGFTLLLVLYYNILLSLTVGTEKSLRVKAIKQSKRFKEMPYITIRGSALESQFQSLVNYSCPAKLPENSNIIWSNDMWQKVNYTNIYLMSAFYDTRLFYMKKNYHYVRILGISKGHIFESSLFCHVWYSGHQNPVVVLVEKEEIWVSQWNSDPNNDIYHAYMFSCPIPMDVKDRFKHPSSVSVLSQTHCGKVSTLLRVQKEGLEEQRAGKPKKKYSICVKGLDYKEDVSLRLIEWIELNLLLGSDKIYFYIFSVHSNISRVLQYYVNKGLVDTKSLTLPGEQPNDPDERTRYLKHNIWNKRHNELMPYNDCLYRNLYKYDFVIPLDIDEVIIPKQHQVWSQMFDHIFAEEPGALQLYASFSAQNVYFLDSFNSPIDSSIPSYFHILQHVIRSSNFSLEGHSVKSFVSTKTTRTVLNHYALDSIYPKMKRNKLLPTSLVQMNHYKKACPRDLYSQCQSNFLKFTKEDKIVLKYAAEVIESVQAVAESLDLL